MSVAVHAARSSTLRRPALPRIALMLAHGRERAALARLDDAALRDIGLDRAGAEAEAARPFWEVSPHR